MITALAKFAFIPPTDFFSVYIYRTTFWAALSVGVFAGAFGCFLYLRKQSLASDVIGHSSLLGVVGAFVFASLWLEVNPQSMLVVTVGAAASGLAAFVLTNWITHHTPLGHDAAMAVSLSLFYGGGMTALFMLNTSSIPGRGGIGNYIFGNAATTRAVDIRTTIGIGLFITLLLVLFWKEFKIYSFDPVASTMYGFLPKIMNPLMFTTITVAIIMGIKSVGMMLMVAFAILPAAATHQFCRRLSTMVGCSALIGGLSGGLGAYISIMLGKVPTGPVVVLVLFTFFLLGILFSPKRTRTVAAALPVLSEEAE